MNPRRLLLALVLALLTLTAPITAAQDTAQETVTKLQTTPIPERDRVDLARRFLGVTETETVTPPTSPFTEGARDTFFVIDETTNTVKEIEAELLAAGEHIYLWYDVRAEVSTEQAQQLADMIDSEVYNQVRDLWGSEPMPGIDGDPRIHALFAFDVSPYVVGYYASDNVYPRSVVPTSNQREMFVFNAEAANFPVGGLASVTAHEFQHMIHDVVKPSTETWFNEGFSTFTQHYLGYEDTASWTENLLNQPDTQLNAWAEEGPRAPHYGAALMFTTYFYERFGLKALQAVIVSDQVGLAAYDDVLQANGEIGVNEVFADWALANLLDSEAEDGIYQYAGFELQDPAIQAEVDEYPFTYQGEAQQYAADYLTLEALEGIDTLTVNFESASVVPLVPLPEGTESGTVWYSNRRDDSDTRLTQAFDLTDVERATLQYRVWYWLEALWDYGYITVSTDGGTTWETLSTPLTTTENPHGTAYGAGYTGQSEGWVDESVSLDAYAGQEILVRFEVITDDATNQHGLMIDDVSIPEIGYASDFETDDGGWQSEGWVRVQNVLPQQFWVQAVQQTEDDPAASVARLPILGEPWRLPLVPGVNRVILAISPYAPLTTVGQSYTITLTPLN